MANRTEQLNLLHQIMQWGQETHKKRISVTIQEKLFLQGSLILVQCFCLLESPIGSLEEETGSRMKPLNLENIFVSNFCLEYRKIDIHLQFFMSDM